MIDSFGRKITYLRLSVTDRCNLRCRYCMPEKGVPIRSHSDMLTEEEMLMAARVAAELGITKIRITGGEPLIKKNILSICRGISSIPGIEETDITTNGTLLCDYAGKLKDAGIKRINISLDTLDPEKYFLMTRGGDLSEALDGIRTALDTGFERVKINTVLMGGFNDDEIRDLALLTMGHELDVRFIELMPMTDCGGFEPSSFISGDEVLKKLPELTPEGLQGTARLYRLPDAKGSIGIIRPLTGSFCESCNRLRLTADGHLKPCLHHSLEYSIKGLGYEGMKEVFIKAIETKPECHAALSAENKSMSGRNMNSIGG